jgi:hypothetical protein
MQQWLQTLLWSLGIMRDSWAPLNIAARVSLAVKKFLRRYLLNLGFFEECEFFSRVWPGDRMKSLMAHYLFFMVALPLYLYIRS